MLENLAVLHKTRSRLVQAPTDKSVHVVHDNGQCREEREAHAAGSVRPQIFRIDVSYAIPEPPNDEEAGEERDELELIRTQVRGEDEHAW